MRLSFGKVAIRNAGDQLVVLEAAFSMFRKRFPDCDGMPVSLRVVKKLRICKNAIAYCRVDGNRYLVYIESDFEDSVAVTALFHELVHVRQRWLGFLDNSYRVGYRVWKGVEYEMVSPSVDWEGYRALPWEDEAFTVEKRLSRKFKRYLKGVV